MGNLYPSQLNNFVTGTNSGLLGTVGHAAAHNALEAKVGVDGSAVTSSHSYKLSGVTGSDKAASLAGTETLYNKAIQEGEIVASALTDCYTQGLYTENTYTYLLTLPASITDTLVARTTTDTLTNKTLASPIFTGTVTLPTGLTGLVKATSGVVSVVTAPSGTVVGTTDTQTLSSKTLTSPAYQGTIDGWISANETWTYASATTITVPSGAAAKYKAGDKIKITQTTTKYFNIVTVADTLLTVRAGSDYTVANATITDNYYSKVQNPIGFPARFNISVSSYTTSGTAFTNQPTTAAASMYIVGNLVYITIAGVSSGTSGGTGRFKANITSNQIPAPYDTGTGNCINYSDYRQGVAYMYDTNVIEFMKYDGTALFGDTQSFTITLVYSF